jgi:hypothetical protein
MRWNQGRATIEKLIADGELQRVPPSREHADQFLAQGVFFVQAGVVDPRAQP